MIEKIVYIMFFVGILCVISLIDIYKQIIPDILLLIAVFFRIGYCYYIGVTGGRELLGILLDGFVISLPVFLLVLFVEKVWKKEVFGGGDIKLLFVTGIYLGWENNLLALFFACIIAIIIALTGSKKGFFPFGPSIAIGAICSMLITGLQS